MCGSTVQIRISSMVYSSVQQLSKKWMNGCHILILFQFSNLEFNFQSNITQQHFFLKFTQWCKDKINYSPGSRLCVHEYMCNPYFITVSRLSICVMLLFYPDHKIFSEHQLPSCSATQTTTTGRLHKRWPCGIVPRCISAGQAAAGSVKDHRELLKSETQTLIFVKNYPCLFNKRISSIYIMKVNHIACISLPVIIC